MESKGKILKRKISAKLKEWWESGDKRPFLLLGARQTGKTKAIELFIEEIGFSSSASSCEIDFVKQPELVDIFHRSQDPDEIVGEIRMVPKYSALDPTKALFFFDEVQIDSLLISGLERFAEQGKYRIIATGSLLSVSMGKSKHPDAKLFRKEEMFPLDFEEFLWANGLSAMDVERIRKISNQSKQMLSSDDLLHEKCLSLFHLFTIIGGLPEPVADYLSAGKEKCFKTLLGLLDKYKDDVKKAYGSNYLAAERVDYLIGAIPSFLARDSRRFFYPNLSRDESVIDEYRKAIGFMNEAGFGYSIRSVCPIKLPFSKNASCEDFKFYPFDSGILNAIQSENAFLSLFGKPAYDCKGDSYETSVLAIMESRGWDVFYSHLDEANAAIKEHQINDPYEIDFLLETKDARFVAIEVKAGNEKAKSIDKLPVAASYKGGYKFGRCKIGSIKDKNLSVKPIYAIQFIDESQLN